MKFRIKKKAGNAAGAPADPPSLEGLIPGKEGIEAFLNPEERHNLNRLVLLSRYVVEGNLAGAHRSPLKGMSSEFADHKSYGMGDDPKHIDWRVVARTDKYYVKRFEDETNLRVYLVLDQSASMNYGSGAITKYIYACRLAAMLGYVVVKARDSAGLFLFSDRIHARMSARNSIQHLNDMLKQIQKSPPGSTSSIPDALHQVAASVRRRALVILISDLLGDENEINLALARLRKQHHDVIALQVLDPRELDFEFKQAHQFQDLEADETLPVQPREIAKEYQRQFGAFIEQYRTKCASMRIDYRLARTDMPPDKFVRAYLQDRRHSTA